MIKYVLAATGGLITGPIVLITFFRFVAWLADYQPGNDWTDGMFLFGCAAGVGGALAGLAWVAGIEEEARIRAAFSRRDRGEA